MFLPAKLKQKSAKIICVVYCDKKDLAQKDATNNLAH